MKQHVVLVAAIAVLAAPAAARAQAGVDAFRGFVSVNGGYQMTSNDFTDGAVFRENSEDGRFDAAYGVPRGRTFAVSGGGRVWRWLGVGAGFSRYSQSTTATLTGAVPHPFFFNRPRAFGSDITGLKREELALNFQLRAVVPVKQVEVSVFGGPSLLRVKQAAVTSISYRDEYPYEEVLVGAQQTTIDASGPGFNAGMDVAVFFARQIGVGLSVQYAGATLNLPSSGEGLAQIKAGGIQTGGGLRLRF